MRPGELRKSKPPGHDADLVERIAWWLDEAFRVPGTRYRIGLDPLIGLIPGVGDTLMTVIQAAVVLLAATSPPYLPKSVIARMAVNVILDGVVGAVPALGSLFDFFFKASSRNLRLIREVRDTQRQGRPVSAAPHLAYVAVVALVFVALVSALVALTFWMVKLLLASLQQLSG